MHYSKEQFKELITPFFDIDWLGVYNNALNDEVDALYIVVEVFRLNDLQEDYIQLLQHLHRRGEAHASYLLGNSYIEGYGVEESLTRAFHYYKQAAEAGHADAANNLADMYLNGEGTDVDENQALHWFSVAAEHGVAEAMFTLGIMYEQGLGVDVDGKQALQFYEQSAANGYVEAQYHLGMVYLEGTHGQDVQIEKAIALFEKAEDAMHVDAVFNLGYIYENGLHVPVDGRKAVHYYKKAAFMGDEQAKERLAEIYEEGILVQRDLLQAKKWGSSFTIE